MKKLLNLTLAVMMALMAFAPMAEAARLSLTVKDSVGVFSGAVAADAADITWVGGNTTDGYQFLATGREIVLVKNTHATTAFTFTLKSVTIKGRTGDIGPYSLAAGETAFIGDVPIEGFRRDADNMVYLEGSDNTIQFAVIRPKKY